MKKIIPFLTISVLLSCSNSRWVAGNAQHFRIRQSHKQMQINAGDTVDFKAIEGKNVILTEKPGKDDNIIITVLKSN